MTILILRRDFGSAKGSENSTTVKEYMLKQIDPILLRTPTILSIEKQMYGKFS